MTKPGAPSERLTRKRRESTSDEREVLALEMIADQLSLIRADISSIERLLRDKPPAGE